jgi:hypothetical protein
VDETPEAKTGEKPPGAPGTPGAEREGAENDQASASKHASTAPCATADAISVSFLLASLAPRRFSLSHRGPTGRGMQRHAWLYPSHVKAIADHA